MRAKHFLKEFAPGKGDDDLPYAEFVVYQCDPSDQFEFIGGPLYQTDSLGMAHKFAYEYYLRYRPKAFVIYQPHAEASRGNYGVKGESDGVDEARDKQGYHTSVSKGKFLPSKYGQNENNLYLHDLMNSDYKGSGPVIVTVNDKRIATEIAAMYGGYVEQTGLGTYRIYKQPGQNQSTKTPALSTVNEFAPGNRDDGDNRSKFLGTVASLFNAGNKIDWRVPGQMGHVVQVKHDGVTMKKYGSPRSKMRYFLPMYDDSRDKQYTIKMIGPKHYAVVSSDPNWQLEERYLSEIERLSKSGYEGGKEELTDLDPGKTLKLLPGGSGLKYSIQRLDGITIKIWDTTNKGEFDPPTKPEKASWHTPAEYRRRLERWEQRSKTLKQSFDKAPGKLIGQLTLHTPYSFPLKNALQVGTITVDEDYRGVGLAKSLYGIALTIMKRPLLAGSSQTPGGRRNWVSLSKIPGVEMKGYVAVDDSDLTTVSNLDAIDDKNDKRWAKAENKRTEQRIDIIMGKLGGQYIGTDAGRHYFAFDVQPNTTKEELKAYVDTNLSKVYKDWGGLNTGLMAIWTGN